MRETPDDHRDTYRDLFEHSADAILIIEGDRFVDCNQATVDMLRCANREEVLRTHPSELSPPTQPDGRSSFEKANEMIALAFEKGNHRFEWDHKRSDGEVFPVEVLLTAVQEDQKKILHVVWRDITERKRLENQLRHSQKMEAVGKLAGGIAHDFNNLLVAILGHSELLLRGIPSASPFHGNVEQILFAGKRAASLVRQLLTFSRKQELQTRVFDLRDTLQSLDSFLERLIGEDIRLVTRTVHDPVRISSDPSQIEQIVINLATNARDAMPDGGQLDLLLRPLEISAEASEDLHEIGPGHYAHLSASDTGRGMPESVRLRAFEPFFTTKDLGEGTGLGLATVYGIVQQAGGSVSLRSTEGEGTTVDVYLPLVGESAPPARVSRRASSERPAGGSELILVAEDEPVVSKVLLTVLKAWGYRVVLASDGLEALEIWLDHPEPFDLLLTDVVMPRMGGPALVRELRRRGHHPNVLFASGYTNDALQNVAGGLDEIDLIEKPFEVEELVTRVRQALDRGAE